MKVKDNVNIKVSTSRNDVDRNQFSFFNPEINQKFRIESIKSTFYFAESDKLRRIYRLKFKEFNKVDELIKTLEASPEVEYVEKIPTYELHFTPNDLGSNSTLGQYALHLIEAEQAWDLSTGDPNIIVAVVDDAVQTDHIDLSANLVAGRDVAEDDSDPNPPDDSFSHGTHVAGIVGATTDNGTGIASIGFGISVMPVKIAADATGNLIAAYEGITWAADNGADVINCSWGRRGPNPDGAFATEQLVIDDAYSKGAILVVSAGNTHYSCQNYPAAYDNVFSVVNTDENDQIFQGSCFNFFPCAEIDNDCTNTGTCFGSYNCGSTYGDWVDICAPGTSIYSTEPTDNYGYKTGTSMASPLVAGLCGLILSANPSLSQEDVINCITSTAVDIDGLNAGYEGLLGAGRINAYEAVLCASSNACPQTLTINDSFTSVDIEDYEASDWIHSTSIINGSANITFDAGNYIELNSGFYAAVGVGGVFEAFIDGCFGSFKTNIVEQSTFSQSLINNVSNSPNPSSVQTTIEYTLSENAKVEILITDFTGKVIQQIKLEDKEKGINQIDFDGSSLPSGTYFCMIRANGEINTHKILIMH